MDTLENQEKTIRNALDKEQLIYRFVMEHKALEQRRLDSLPDDDVAGRLFGADVVAAYSYVAAYVLGVMQTESDNLASVVEAQKVTE